MSFASARAEGCCDGPTSALMLLPLAPRHSGRFLCISEAVVMLRLISGVFICAGAVIVLSAFIPQLRPHWARTNSGGWFGPLTLTVDHEMPMLASKMKRLGLLAIVLSGVLASILYLSGVTLLSVEGRNLLTLSGVALIHVTFHWSIILPLALAVVGVVLLFFSTYDVSSG